jgi:hypothetical protein
MVSARSLLLPGLVVSSTTRVNIHWLFSLERGRESVAGELRRIAFFGYFKIALRPGAAEGQLPEYAAGVNPVEGAGKRRDLV